MAAGLRGAVAALTLWALAGNAAAGLPDIQTWRTGNGAQVLHVHAPEIPMVDLDVTFNAAAARDGDLPGLARMVNGLLFEGAGGRDADAIARGFDDLGADYGASSQRDMASVSLRALTDPEVLEPAADLLATVLTQPDFPPAAVERVRAQMQVSLRNLRQEPGQLAGLTFFQALYEGHPYGSSPYGTTESLAAIRRADLQAFHERYYVARNATVVIVGDLDRGRAERLAEQVVGGLPAGEPAPPLPAPAAPAAGGVTVVAHPSTQTHLRLGHPAIHRGHPDYFPLLVGNHALGGNGLVSLLAQAVREERGLSYAISSGLTPMQVAGPFRVTLQTSNARIAEAVEVVRETLAEFIAEGPPADDLALARKNLVGGFPLRIDSNAQVASYLSMIGFYDLPLDWLATWTEQVEAVTGEAVQDAFRRHLDLGAMRLVLVGDVPAAQREQVEALFGGAPQGVETAAR